MKLLPLSALARKSVADVTRRKGRTLLVVLGILIGVAGLTAINVADSALAGGLAYSADETATPSIYISVSGVEPSVLPAVQGVPNVRAAQVATFYDTRWTIAATPGHASMTIIAYQDPHHVSLDPFQLTSGRLPGPGEIVMDSSDRQLQDFNMGDTVRVETAHGEERLTVVGLARTLGEASATFNNRAEE